MLATFSPVTTVHHHWLHLHLHMWESGHKHLTWCGTYCRNVRIVRSLWRKQNVNTSVGCGNINCEHFTTWLDWKMATGVDSIKIMIYLYLLFFLFFFHLGVNVLKTQSDILKLYFIVLSLGQDALHQFPQQLQGWTHPCQSSPTRRYQHTYNRKRQIKTTSHNPCKHILYICIIFHVCVYVCDMCFVLLSHWEYKTVSCCPLVSDIHSAAAGSSAGVRGQTSKNINLTQEKDEDETSWYLHFHSTFFIIFLTFYLDPFSSL